MAQEQEHERVEDMVEAPGEAERAARTLEQAAASHQTLEGFEAINNVRLPESVDDKDELLPGDSSNI